MRNALLTAGVFLGFLGLCAAPPIGWALVFCLFIGLASVRA